MTYFKMATPFAIVATLALSAGAAFADPDPANFGGNGGAWENDYAGHFVNQTNPALRMDWDTGRKAIPGKAAAAQAANPTTNDSDHNVISRPSSTLVDPHRTLP